MGWAPPLKINKSKKIILSIISFLSYFSLTVSSGNANTPVPSENITPEAVEEFISSFTTPEIQLQNLEPFILALDDTSPVETRLHLAAQKISLLADLGNQQKASHYATEILDTYDPNTIQNIDLYIDLMDNVTSIYTLSLEISKAFQALDLQRAYLANTPSLKLQQSIDVLLANIYITTMDYQRGIDAYLAIIQNSDYRLNQKYYEHENTYLNNIAYAYNRLEQPDQALDFLNRAQISITKNIENTQLRKVSLAFNVANRGRALLLKQDFETALQLGIDTILSGEELGQAYLSVIGYRLAGHASYQMEQYQNANNYLTKGIALAEQLHLAHMLKPLYKDQANAYEAQKLFKKALTAARKYETAREAVHQSADRARLALFSAENENLKRQQEIAALKRENHNQKVINGRDKRVKALLATSAILLLSILGIFIRLYIEQHRSRRLLEESEQSAQRASEAKSAFLANMSHEIRTPMNGVLGMTELLRSTSLDKTQQTYANTIYKSGSALLTIINDILDFSKIEAGKLELAPISCNLKEGIEDVAALLATKAHDKNIDLIVRYAPELPENVVADIGRIRQIITNLVGNAIKFTEKGYVLIDVSGTVENKICNVTLTVTDTGIGIEEDKLEHIFGEFTQAENSTTRRFGGTGLGLAISRSLVTAMRGTLVAVSKVGEGSSFSVNLALPYCNLYNPQETPFITCKDITVLIISDNKINTDIQNEQLRAWGISSHSASNVEKALSALRLEATRGKAFDIALINDPIGYGDVAKLVQNIQEDIELSSTKIIVLSSTSNMVENHTFRNMKVDNHLTKPIRSSLLLETITSTIDKTSGTEPQEIVEINKAHKKSHTALEEEVPLRILIAEDNEVNRLVLKSFLNNQNIKLTFAVNGREALDFATTADFDMILMDISMPEMDGIEATIEIRAYEEKNARPRTPIICLTAHVMAEDKESSFACGMDDYLSKPLQKIDLDKTIQKWRTPKFHNTDSDETQPAIKA